MQETSNFNWIILYKENDETKLLLRISWIWNFYCHLKKSKKKTNTSKSIRKSICSTWWTTQSKNMIARRYYIELEVFKWHPPTPREKQTFPE